MHSTFSTAALFLVLGGSFAPLAVADPAASSIVATDGQLAPMDRDAIRAALALLPKQPARVAVIDVTQCRPAVRDSLLTLDAFIVRGNGVIYVVRQSAVLRGARSGANVFRAMLAAILWHEMAHLDGADERGAQQAEEDLWRGFVRDGVADTLTGLRYLALLRNRRDDILLVRADRGDSVP